MSLVQERYPIFRSRPYRSELSSLRRELLSARRELLLQASNQTAWQSIRRDEEDVLALSSFSQQGTLYDLITGTASAKLRRIDRALGHMCKAAYGLCHECRGEISLSRLRHEPHAVLCDGCIEQRIEPLTADAL